MQGPHGDLVEGPAVHFVFYKAMAWTSLVG